jgi:hypothetical protein
MTSDDVRQIMEREIGKEWSRTNAHGCDLRHCLVNPQMREFENCGRPGAGGKIGLWLILEENPGARDGYQIVFEESSGEFGLACPGFDGPIFLGRYGSFLCAFEAM